MAPRGRHRIKTKMAGNTRMDAALDAMSQYGFEEKLVRETVEELLDVYEGAWPFIEEGSYNLLIETILGKQQTTAEEKENARRDGVAETSSAATLTAGITEVGSSSLVNQDPLLHASDGLDSASQTNDQGTASPCNQATNVKDSTVPAERGGHGQGIREEPRHELKPADNVTGSHNTTTNVGDVESTFVKTTMIESPAAPENLPHRRRKPYYGWIGDDDDKVELIHFPLPPSPEHIQKLIAQSEAPQSGRRRRRKSRWDEKPDDV